LLLENKVSARFRSCKVDPEIEILNFASSNQAIGHCRAYRSGNVALGPEPVCHSAGLRRDGTTITRGCSRPVRDRRVPKHTRRPSVGNR
jgi:hypothetical protein